MTTSAAPARPGDVPAFAVAGLFWTYYMTPLAVRPDPWGFALVVGVPGLIAVGALTLRRRRPVLTVGIVAICLVVSAAATGAGFVALAHLAHRAERVWTVAVGALALVAAKAVNLVVLRTGGRTALDGITSAVSVESTVLVAGVAIAALIGRLLRSDELAQASRAASAIARAEAEQARLAEARLAERARIAREMHDVVAHRISLVAMRAGVLAHRTADPEVADEAALIQTSARDALAELRVVLADLRGTDAPPEPPQPTLADLPVLVAEARDAGQLVDLDLTVPVGEVPARLSRQAYRIVQEGLTNARRHAPGAPVGVTVTGRPGTDLIVEVTNPVTDLALPDGTSAGLGLVGVAERVDLLGGSVNHGVASGRFGLRASLPWTQTA